MAIFDISPPQTVNKGLAEDYDSKLPQQLQLITNAAAMRQRDEMFQKRLAQQEKQHNLDLWKELATYNFEGLNSYQSDAMNEATNGFLGGYKDYIAGNKEDVPWGDVFAGRNALKSMKQKFMAFNTELKEASESQLLNGLYGANREDMLSRGMQTFKGGVPDANFSPGAIMDELTSYVDLYDPENLAVMALSGQGERTKSKFSDKSLAGSRYAVVENQTFPGVWEVDENGNLYKGPDGKPVLTKSFINNLPTNDPYFDKWIAHEQERTGRPYGEILYEAVYPHAMPKTELEKFDEASRPATGGKPTGPQLKLQAQYDMLEGMYPAFVARDEDVLNTLNTIGGATGMRFEFAEDENGVFIQPYLMKQTFESPDQMQLMLKRIAQAKGVSGKDLSDPETIGKQLTTSDVPLLNSKIRLAKGSLSPDLRHKKDIQAFVDLVSMASSGARSEQDRVGSTVLWQFRDDQLGVKPGSGIKVEGDGYHLFNKDENYQGAIQWDTDEEN